MNPAFLPPASSLPLRRRGLPTCKRPQRRVHTTPTSLAKFQRQQETNESPESETPLESIIPPPALPTLTTLTGQTRKQDKPSETPQPEIDLSQISTQGPGISKEAESEILILLKGLLQEFALIEWPSFDRVIRLTVIIVVTIIVAVTGLYFVDGFLYRMASIVFEGKI